MVCNACKITNNLSEVKMAKHNKEYYFEQIRINLDDDKRFTEKLQWIKDMVKHYSEVLGFSEDDIIEKLEENRNYWAANYYQESNQPRLDKDIVIFDNLEQLMKIFPSRNFRCSICGGITTNPYECNSGIKRKDGKICDWKTYGLLKAHDGFRFTIKDKFLENPIIDNIFKPIELESNTIQDLLKNINGVQDV